MAGRWGSPTSPTCSTTRSFRQAVLNTFYFVLLSVPAFVVLGLFLALALNDTYRRSAVLRSIFFGSSVLSVTIVTLIWRLVYMPERGMLAAATERARPAAGQLHDRRRRWRCRASPSSPCGGSSACR